MSKIRRADDETFRYYTNGEFPDSLVLSIPLTMTEENEKLIIKWFREHPNSKYPLEVSPLGGHMSSIGIIWNKSTTNPSGMRQGSFEFSQHKFDANGQFIPDESRFIPDETSALFEEDI